MRTALVLLTMLFAASAEAQFSIGQTSHEVRTALLRQTAQIDSTSSKEQLTYCATISEDTGYSYISASFERDTLVSFFVSVVGLDLKAFEREYGWMLKHPEFKRTTIGDVTAGFVPSSNLDYYFVYQADEKQLIIEITKKGKESSIMVYE